MASFKNEIRGLKMSEMKDLMTEYNYTEKHNKEQWAWEFLRRNPEYQQKYKQFIHRWHTLESVYGKDPDRDLQGWQKDLRSLANEWDSEMTLLEEHPDVDRDNSYQEPIQIEAWMSLKWGFKCFPLDPETHSLEVLKDIEWHEQVIDLDDIRFDAESTDPIAQVNFDLRYSLQDQLDAAHKDLINLTSQLKRLGKVKLVAADHYHDWLEQLKILDDTNLFEQSSEEQQLAALEMCKTGYRQILLMRG